MDKVKKFGKISVNMRKGKSMFENQYQFRKAKKEEVSQMFHLILERMKWMSEKAIKQWIIGEYEEIYPESYYEEERQKGHLYVLQDVQNQDIVCGAVLLTEDSRWHDQKKAIYIHNFASKVGVKGVGKVFIECVEQLAEENHQDYVRLDSAKSNKALASYYESQGYMSVGECQEGPYQGILREKKIEKAKNGNS